MMVTTQKVRVAIYARVSTEHEAQISALSNQLEWYYDQIDKNNDWVLTKEYVDEGITGTQAKKRPQFMKMIEDLDKREFDLVITREVCRFARNIEETMKYTRIMKEHGVEVYFISDNIRTFSQDGILRLGIMATLAQEESRKISERVIAGQKISRDKGVLYGNGNILGYDLKRNIDANGKWDPSENTYIINEEQAETVRIIFDMYLNGAGTMKIASYLTKTGRKNADGKVCWNGSRICRILHNMTYAGYLRYNQSEVEDFLTHKRKANKDKETWIIKKGNWEPLVSKEDWDKVQVIMAAKTKEIHDKMGESMITGNKLSDDVWKRKLVCKCGHNFRRNKWRINKNNNKMIYGYQCYNQLRNGAASTRDKMGLSPEGYCDVKMIADWRLDLMAKIILDEINENCGDYISESIELVKNNLVETSSLNDKTIKRDISRVESEIKKAKKHIDRLLELRLEDELTKEEYLDRKKSKEEEINKLNEQLKKYEGLLESMDSLESQEKKINETLDKIKEVSERYKEGMSVEDIRDIFDIICEKIIAGNAEFKWVLNLSNGNGNTLINEEAPIFKRHIGFEEARSYRRSSKRLLRENQWVDIDMEVSIIV